MPRDAATGIKGKSQVYIRGEPDIHASGHYEDGVAAAAAAASAAAFFRSFSGLGRRLPNVPLKILPRLDRRSPLPIIHLRKKCAEFTNRTRIKTGTGEPLNPWSRLGRSLAFPA
jgi:hypothetical protein